VATGVAGGLGRLVPDGMVASALTGGLTAAWVALVLGLVVLLLGAVALGAVVEALQVPDAVDEVERPRVDLAVLWLGVNAALVAQPDLPPLRAGTPSVGDMPVRFLSDDVGHALQEEAPDGANAAILEFLRQSAV
jgi:pimeloyl-ACP methyl ester carboxylesterase